MRLIDKLTDSANQLTNLIGENGEQIQLRLQYMPTQNSWYFDLEYRDLIIKGSLLTVSPNILRSYYNLIPFGIMVTSTDGYEPQFITDFISERIKVYTLNQADIDLVEEEFFRNL